MKFNVNVKEMDFDKRIRQFEKYSKTGCIYIDEKSRYIIFKNGKPENCNFDGENDFKKVLECFKNLKKGSVCIVIEEGREMKKSPSFINDYILVERGLKYLAGNTELEKPLRNLLKCINSSSFKKLSWEIESVFFSYSNLNSGVFIKNEKILFCIFSKKANYNMIKNKIVKFF